MCLNYLYLNKKMRYSLIFRMFKPFSYIIYIYFSLSLLCSFSNSDNIVTNYASNLLALVDK